MYIGEHGYTAGSNGTLGNFTNSHVSEETINYLQSVTEAVFWKPGMHLLKTRDNKSLTLHPGPWLAFAPGFDHPSFTFGHCRPGRFVPGQPPYTG
jgi:hypothetical protein